MSDSAKGPLAGYIFQFEKALLLLSSLENANEYITIEEVDDTSSHAPDGTVITTVQAKHSISISGTTFEDTSSALWRTFEIWISKLKSNIFQSETSFICVTNKKIPDQFLLKRIKMLDFDSAIIEIESVLKEQELKLKALIAKDKKAGSSVKKTITLIKFALNNKSHLQTVHKNLRIDDEEDVKERFLNKINLTSKSIPTSKQDDIYYQFNGWIINRSKAKWLNSDIAKFTKEEFSDKFISIITSPAITSAVFRKKELLGISFTSDEISKKRKDLFVKQIEEIDRRKDAKDRIVYKAIIDFLCCDIEMKYIIEDGNYTQEDFDSFLEVCCEFWQTTFDQKIKKEFSEYSEIEKNSLAIDLYDTIMSKITLEFKEGFAFNSTNEYIRNGSFLKLSDIPKIGWHPEWKIKYIENES